MEIGWLFPGCSFALNAFSHLVFTSGARAFNNCLYLNSAYYMPGIVWRALTPLILTAALWGRHCSFSHFTGKTTEAQGGLLAKIWELVSCRAESQMQAGWHQRRYLSPHALRLHRRLEVKILLWNFMLWGELAQQTIRCIPCERNCCMEKICVIKSLFRAPNTCIWLLDTRGAWSGL